MNRHTIGTDPEFFVRNSEGKFVNAETMFPGTKHAPHQMESGAGLQTDNVAVEFASPVAADGKDFVDKLQTTFSELFKMLPKNMVLDMSASAIFPEEELQTEQAKLFGCSPSYDAWELRENEQPKATDSNLRSTGAHIHIGNVPGDGNDFLRDPYGKIDTVRMCDCLHGLISIVLDQTPESIRRRELYGKAGEHRPTEYGVEYRTLSSFWLKSPNLVMMIDALTADALRMIREDKHQALIADLGGGKNIQRIINNGLVKEADDLIANVLYKHMSDDSKHLFEECRRFIENYDFVKEWSLTAAA